jgi:2-methylisocitrate lyase-like PEP mutase family enzyme
VLVGVVDALTARIAVEAGFEAVYATGAGIANAQLGVPDIGLLTQTEMLTQVERIVSAVDLPVVADLDTGYGNALNAARAVRMFERAGVAGVQIEDQVFPKQCGHFNGTEVVSADEFLGKLAAVLDARSDPDVLVIARTDAIASRGVDEAIDRARRFADAGADVVFVEAPADVATLDRLPREIRAPLLLNLVEGGRTPQLSVSELGAMGYRIVLFANTALRLAALAVKEGLAVLRRDGSSAALADRLLDWNERQRLVGLDDYRALADRYASMENRGQ